MSARPLHVLWLIDHVCYDGSLHGGGRLYWNLLPKFDPARVQVHPYFLRASEEVRRVFADAPVPVTVLDKGKYDPTTLFDVMRLCRRHQIDVMHLFCYASSSFGRLAGLLRGVPTVIHDFDTQIYFPYPLYLRVLDRLLARGTGRAIAASPMCSRYLRDVRGVPAARIEQLPHAVPDEVFEVGLREDRRRARARLRWAEGSFVFCAVTKLGPERGNETLLRAFARVAQRRSGVRLVIVHKPTLYHRVPEAYRGLESVREPARLREEIEELVRKLGLEDRVQLVESLDQPQDYVLASDAVVAPFENERFSSVYLLEAFALGRTAVATALGEQRELIRHGVDGLLVEPGDEEALAGAMLRLIEHPEERERLALAAAARARQHSVAEVAERLTQLYRELAAGDARLGALAAAPGGRRQ